MPELILVEELRAYLITEGLVQAPDMTPSLVVPSVWLDPREGAPEPRQGENIAVTLVDTMLSGPPFLEAWLEESFIDVIVRSRQKPAAVLFHRSIRNLLAPISALAGRKHWQMNDLLVERTTIWRPEQPVDVPGDDVRTYTRTAAFRFQVRRKALAGTPLLP